MRTTPVPAVLTFVWLSAGATVAAPPDPDETEALLRRMTQELLDAVAPGEVEVWRRHLHDRLLRLDENGNLQGKADLLDDLGPLPPGLEGRIEIDRFEARVLGETAVAAYEVQESLSYHGQQLRSRFRAVDTWIETPAGWRLLASHTAAVLKDPPAIEMAQEALCAYAGEYRLAPAIRTTIRCGDDGLISERTGRSAVRYLPELRDLFFSPGSPRVRRIFTRDASANITGFVDRREGEDVRWIRVGPMASGAERRLDAIRHRASAR